VDFENVQPSSLDKLSEDHFRILVFVGANQSKLPFETAEFLQHLGPRADYVKISGNGSNALDFHIAYYIGKLAAADPSGCFHILSKDAGFDPLIQHLKSKKISVGRVKAIADIPLVKAASTKSPNERLELVIARLRQFKAAKPRTIKTLSSTMASLFQNQLSEGEISVLMQKLVKRGYLSISETKVTYTLPEES
jgi:hypothetical protein